MSLGIYIHIPFCAAKCNYCDFNSRVASDSLKTEYIDALCKEIEGFAEGGDIVDTIYFGGGTPTILEPEQLIRILDAVRHRFSVDENCEITTECNPATMGYDGFAALKGAGFNRISIGVQSADDEQLRVLGRIHNFDDAQKCVAEAKRAGFDNISLDLMFGIPNQDLDSWQKTLNSAIALSPEHISCYALKIEEGTPFASMDLNIADDDKSCEMYERCVELLRESGYSRYEISNFARSGFESRHNCKYWKCEGFIGFGAGAYSCYMGERYSNIYDVKEYVECVARGESPIFERIALDKSDMMSEFVFLGLRMDAGISGAEFEERFSLDIFDVFKEQIEKNIKRGTIIQNGDRLKIPPDFIYVSNAILSDFV